MTEASRFRPLSDHVLIQPLPADVTESGLSLGLHTDRKGVADSLLGSLQRGLIVACGPGERLLRLTCQQCGDWRNITEERAQKRDLHCGCGGCTKAEVIGRQPMHLKPGDVILYPYRTGTPITLDGERYDVVHEEQWPLATIES